jgi:hypothetical protein
MESAGFRLVVIVWVDILIISQGSPECYLYIILRAEIEVLIYRMLAKVLYPTLTCEVMIASAQTPRQTTI